MKFKRRSFFTVGSYSYFVEAMRAAAQRHGNKPGGYSLRYAEAFCIMNSIIIFCSCIVLCWVLILTDESSGGQKAVKSGGAVAGFSVLWSQL